MCVACACEQARMDAGRAGQGRAGQGEEKHGDWGGRCVCGWGGGGVKGSAGREKLGE